MKIDQNDKIKKNRKNLKKEVHSIFEIYRLKKLSIETCFDLASLRVIGELYTTITDGK